MKVILEKDVADLGKKGQMVEASDGYARNYLIPKGLAVEANSTNINIMKSRLEAEKRKKEKELENARKVAESLKNKVVTLKAKAGENGKLFGSITSKDVADAIKAQLGIEVDRRKLAMPEAIKTLGSIEIEVKVYPEVSTKLTVSVVQE